jgi:hypothetical protein
MLGAVSCKKPACQDHRRSLSFVEQHLQPRRGHAGRWPVGLLDASQKPLDPLGAHVGEPDDTYVHGNSSTVGLLRLYDFAETEVLRDHPGGQQR